MGVEPSIEQVSSGTNWVLYVSITESDWVRIWNITFDVQWIAKLFVSSII